MHVHGTRARVKGLKFQNDPLPKAELVVLAANQRIGEEIRAIPKAGNRFTAAGKSESRSAIGIPGTSRDERPLKTSADHGTLLSRRRRNRNRGAACPNCLCGDDSGGARPRQLSRHGWRQSERGSEFGTD
jgi:hypothetical protein